MRTSSSSIALRSAAISLADLGQRRPASASASASSSSTRASSSRARSRSTRLISPLHVGQPRGDLLRLGLVVPQVGRGRLLPRARAFSWRMPVEVEHGLDVAQGRVEVLELFGVIGSGHDSKTIAAAREP